MFSKKIKIILLSFVLFCSLALTLQYIYKNCVIFYWVNPYTNTQGYKYIADSMKELNKAFEFARKSSEKEGYKYSYIFQNAYGSGFLHNNPIPNDLDYSIGIDLGEYEYDGKNAKEIAESVISKMDSFQDMFNIYINEFCNRDIYSTDTPFEKLSYTTYNHNKNVEQIFKYLPYALKGEDYVLYTNKTLPDGNLDIPFVMRANTILIQDYDPIMLMSDIVKYNTEMKTYLREISIIPEFFLTVKHDNKVSEIEIVPESFTGERLQLSRRFYAASTFSNLYSRKFLKQTNILHNDEDYLYYRMLSYKRHLQEISNIQIMKDRPIKMLKRIQQTADIISPMLDSKTKSEIDAVVFENMSNKNIQLLNDYHNICTNIMFISQYPKMHMKLIQNGKLNVMYNSLLEIIEDLKKNNEIDVKKINVLEKYAKEDIHSLLGAKNYNEVRALNEKVFIDNFKVINDTVNFAVYDIFKGKEKLLSHINLFNSIYTDCGFHKVYIYLLSTNNYGILKDDYTKNIKDFKQFAKDNKLADVNYKLLDKKDVPTYAAKYTVWARYNSTDEQNKNYEILKQKLLNDKTNFYIKRKIIFK